MSLAIKNGLPRTALHFLAPAALLSASLLSSGVVSAATLQQVFGWEQGGEPDNISMHIYVADNLAENPPILVVLHFCGGNQNAVFGQASGMRALADENGFILVIPATTLGCWDVATDAALTNGGGGHTGAIVNMVDYAVSEYGGNADRVYAVGTSGGAMAMQGLLAVYPEVFKAGSGFSGVPAGCWAVGNADGSWSNDCANGNVTHTGQEWGDMVRAMNPGYDGIRPRVQIYHGDNDETISFTNHTEAVKQWVNVLDLSDEPTDTSVVNVGGTNFNREEWKDECGTTLLDVLTQPGGAHNTGANMNAQEVNPFLSLNIVGADDPYAVSDCAPSDSAIESGTGDTGSVDDTGSVGDTGNAGDDTSGNTNGQMGPISAPDGDGMSDVGSGNGETGSEAASGSGDVMAGGVEGAVPGNTLADSMGMGSSADANTNDVFFPDAVPATEQAGTGCTVSHSNGSRPFGPLMLAGLCVAFFTRRRRVAAQK